MGLKINKAVVKEVKCPQCDVINEIKLLRSGGTITFFCKLCGAEIHLVFDRMILDMELKRPATQHQNSQVSK